jgi:hypothetical protein
MMSVEEALVKGYLSNENIDTLENLAQSTLGTGQRIGQDAADMAKFQPFTVTSTLGGATVDPSGSVNVTTTEEERALSAGLLGGAGGAFNRAMVDPAIAQEELYNQMRAIQRPEEQRDRLAMEQRLFNQGRMGVSSAAYGGASPELLAQEQAIQDNMLKANLAARGQSMQELGQFTDMGTSMLAGAYTPQAQALGLLGAGTNIAQLADLGRRTGAGLFSDLSQKAYEPYTALLQEAAVAEAERDLTLADILFG